MGRGVISYSIIFISGIYTSKFLSVLNIVQEPAILIAASFITLLTSLFYKKHYLKFIAMTHVTLFVLGVSAYNLQGISIDNKIVTNRDKVICYATEGLKRFASNPEEHSILCALTLGVKKEIPEHIKESYSNAGVMHVLALSGLHIGIIYLILSSILFPLNCSFKLRRHKTFIILTIICIYAFLTGGAPSIIRASITIIIYSLSTILCRKSNKWNKVALCALIMGILYPKEITQIGAQLSFAAIIGILWLFPIIEESEKIVLDKIKCNKIIKGIVKRICDIVGISISCQIMTLPLTALYFGGYAHYFIIANLIAIPLTTAILYILIAAILTMPIDFINGYLCTSLSYVIRLMNSLVEYLS